MHKVDAPGATAGNEHTDGDPGTATPATVLAAKWHNTVQRELVNIVEAESIVLDDGDDQQVLEALDLRYLQALPTHDNAAHSDTYIEAAGVTYGNLNANGDVGQGAGQVAAGDDSRFLTQAQKDGIAAAPNPITNLNPATDKQYVDGLSGLSGNFRGVQFAKNSASATLNVAGGWQTVVSITIPAPTGGETHKHTILAGVTHNSDAPVQHRIHDGAASLQEKDNDPGTGANHSMMLAAKTGITAAVTYDYDLLPSNNTTYNPNSRTNANSITVLIEKE